MSRKLLLSAVLLLSAGYCYSNGLNPYYGYTPNAAASGNTWGMDSVFPSDTPGLEVQNIIYNYTIQKQIEDSVTVHVQNKNALGDGYIFRETDEWRPGSLGGTDINKVVPVIPNIPREAWGDGSIVTEGNGSVTDANVVYTYKVDPCYDPQFNPACPGYMPELPTYNEIELYNALDDTYVNNAMQETDTDIYEEEEKKEAAKDDDEDKRKERLEKAFAAADNALLFADAFAQSQMLDAMNMAMNINMNNYYTATIDGGVYNESVVLLDKELPDNKRGLRNGYAQQLLHEKMVDEQYGR